MPIRFDVLLSTFEHVQLEYGILGKNIGAKIVLDTKNLTKQEINLVRRVNGLPELDTWYPKIMREVILFDFFKPASDPKVASLKRAFATRYEAIMGHSLNEESWSDKSIRPKQHGKHAKEWAASMVEECRAKHAAQPDTSDFSPS
jgi:hypothetical protein